MAKIPHPVQERTERDGLREVAAEQAAQIKERKAREKIGGRFSFETRPRGVYTEKLWRVLWPTLTPLEKKWMEHWHPVVKERCVRGDGELDWDLFCRRMLAVLSQIHRGERPGIPGTEEIHGAMKWPKP